MLSTYKLINWFGVLGGVELVNRSNKSTGRIITGQLNGYEVKGSYWQITTGFRFFTKRNIKIDVRATIPKISSLTQVFDGLPIGKRMVVEQLRAFKVSASVPIL